MSITSNLARRVCDVAHLNMSMCGCDLRTFLHLFSTAERNEILMTELILGGIYSFEYDICNWSWAYIEVSLVQQ